MEPDNNGISLETLKSKLAEDKADVILIDVRSKEEFDEQHIPGAYNIPASELGNVTDDEWKNKTVVTVCNHGGNRSQLSAQLLLDQGIEKAFFLEEGTAGWFEEENKKSS